MNKKEILQALQKLKPTGIGDSHIISSTLRSVLIELLKKELK